eukprot:CFRG3041T1
MDGTLKRPGIPSPVKCVQRKKYKKSLPSLNLDLSVESHTPPEVGKLVPEEAHTINCNESSASGGCGRTNKSKEEKEARRVERENMRREKLVASFTRQLMAEATRGKTDDEIFEQLHVTLDTNLTRTMDAKELIEALHSLGVATTICDQRIANIIKFRRNCTMYDTILISNSNASHEDELPVGAIRRNVETEEQEILYIMEGRKFVDLIVANDLAPYLKSFRLQVNENRLFLIVDGIDKIYKAEVLARNRYYRERALNGIPGSSSTTTMSQATQPGVPIKQKIDMAILELQVNQDVHVMCTKNSQMTVSTVVAIAKSIALRRKRKSTAVFEWCTEGIKKENTLPSIWRAHLCCFLSVSLEVANAIASQFPSINSLIYALNTAPSKSQFIQELSMVKVDRASKCNRKIGPSLAARIYDFFGSKTGVEKVY